MCKNSSAVHTVSRYIYISETIHCVIQVVRMICTCEKTFVVLPPQIVPFKRYLLAKVLQAIRIAVHQTIYQVNKITGLASRLICYWYQQYRQWHQTIITVQD
ncbi:DUF6431 domain-containing protein [Loigolactobacillus coryniformis]|uniref:DUF6431 domain-containing protein n=1 Tax=Loigolactobacillus coryniformis TaxID=1610 RepID=UPI001C5FDB02